MGHLAMVSLWCVALLYNNRFCIPYFIMEWIIIVNCFWCFIKKKSFQTIRKTYYLGATGGSPSYLQDILPGCHWWQSTLFARHITWVPLLTVHPFYTPLPMEFPLAYLSLNTLSTLKKLLFNYSQEYITPSPRLSLK